MSTLYTNRTCSFSISTRFTSVRISSRLVSKSAPPLHSPSAILPPPPASPTAPATHSSSAQTPLSPAGHPGKHQSAAPSHASTSQRSPAASFPAPDRYYYLCHTAAAQTPPRSAPDPPAASAHPPTPPRPAPPPATPWSCRPPPRSPTQLHYCIDSTCKGRAAARRQRSDAFPPPRNRRIRSSHTPPAPATGIAPHAGSTASACGSPPVARPPPRTTPPPRSPPPPCSPTSPPACCTIPAHAVAAHFSHAPAAAAPASARCNASHTPPTPCRPDYPTFPTHSSRSSAAPLWALQSPAFPASGTPDKDSLAPAPPIQTSAAPPSPPPDARCNALGLPLRACSHNDSHRAPCLAPLRSHDAPRAASRAAIAPESWPAHTPPPPPESAAADHPPDSAPAHD